jgi:hypothetical protein
MALRAGLAASGGSDDETQNLVATVGIVGLFFNPLTVRHRQRLRKPFTEAGLFMVYTELR